MKKLILSLFKSKMVAALLIKPVLKLHNACYSMASIMGVALGDGIHPKHDIIRYSQWFEEHIQAGDVIIDIGSNAGDMVEDISKKAAFVYGIENNQKLYQKSLERRISNIQFIFGDATTFDYSTVRSIDKITLSNVLEHIHDRVTFLRSITERISWRNPAQKILLIRVPMIDRDWITVYKKQIGVEWRLDKTHETEYTLKDLESEIQAIQGKIIEHQIRFGELFAVCKL